MRGLSEAEHRRIEDAAGAVAKLSDVRFIFALVHASERYRLYPVVWAAMLTLMAAGIGAAWRPALPFGEGFAGEAAVFVVLSLLFEWAPIRLALVPRRLKRAQARHMAQLEFAARVLAQQPPRGVLVFVSLAERTVEILADRETHARIGEAAWQATVEDFTKAAKAGRLADGAVAAIETCAAHLERHFPKQG